MVFFEQNCCDIEKSDLQGNHCGLLVISYFLIRMITTHVYSIFGNSLMFKLKFSLFISILLALWTAFFLLEAISACALDRFPNICCTSVLGILCTFALIILFLSQIETFFSESSAFCYISSFPYLKMSTSSNSIL